MEELTRKQAMARDMAGLSNEGYSIKAEVPNSVSESRLRVRQLGEQYRAGLIDGSTLHEAMAEINATGSFEELIQKLRERILQHSTFTGTDQMNIDVIATFDDHAFVRDWKNENYFRIDYELDANDNPRITNVSNIQPKQMVKENAEVLHLCVRRNILDMGDGKGFKILRIAEDLADFEAYI